MDAEPTLMLAGKKQLNAIRTTWELEVHAMLTIYARIRAACALQ